MPTCRLRGKVPFWRLTRTVSRSSPHLNRRLNEHPKAGNRDAPLWCHRQDGTKKLSYHYILPKLLERAKERVGLEKPVKPHHFHHSRATYLANQFMEAQLCEWFGWVQGSDIPAKYVHLSGRDIDREYGKLHGIVEEDEEDQQPTVQRCPRCDELNEPEAAYCIRCGFALDQEEAADFEADVGDKMKGSYRDTDPSGADTMEKLEILDELLDDPDIKRLLHERMTS